METIFQTAGTVAGIGGLAIALVLIIFKKIISGRFFPKLNQAQAYRVIRQIIVACFILSALGIAAYTYSIKLKQVPEKKDPSVNITTQGDNSPAVNTNGNGNVDINIGGDDKKDTAK